MLIIYHSLGPASAGLAVNLEDTSNSDCSSTKNVLPDGETASDVIPVYRRQYGCCTTANESGDSSHSDDVAGRKPVCVLTGVCSWLVSCVVEAAMRSSTFVEMGLSIPCFSHGRARIAEERPTRVEASELYVFPCGCPWDSELRREVRVQP